MNKTPTLYTLKALHKIATENNPSANTTEGWVPARPFGYYSLKNRFMCAWMVFTGKADAFTWPGGQ